MLSLTLLMLGGVTVELPTEAKVQGAEMTLGQVATVTGDDPAEVARVAGLTLGYAPSPGYSRVIQRWKVADTIRTRFAGVEATFTGAEASRVFPETAVVTSVELRTSAQQALEGLFVGEDATIRPVGELNDETVPMGVKGRQLLAEPALASVSRDAQNPGAWSVPVRIIVDGMPYRTVWTSFDVDVYRMMPVLKRDIAKGEKISRGDITLERTAVRSATGISPLAEDKLVGATAKRVLMTGQPVGERDVIRSKAVKRGETIDLLVEKRAIQVTAKVVALADGYIGDTISVQVLSSGKELTATVDRKGHVILSLSAKN